MATRARKKRTVDIAAENHDMYEEAIEYCKNIGDEQENEQYQNTLSEVILCAGHEPMISTTSNAPSYSSVYEFLSYVIKGENPPKLSEQDLAVLRHLYYDLKEKVSKLPHTYRQQCQTKLSRKATVRKKQSKCTRKKKGSSSPKKNKRKKKSVNPVLLTPKTFNPFNVTSEGVGV